MLKFLVTRKDSGPLVGFGVTEENVERLKAGLPILVNLREMGIDAEITIFYGETAKDLYGQISSMIDETTLVYHEGSPDESGVSEGEQKTLISAGYKVKESKYGWSPSFRGQGLIRGWAKSESKAWWFCWNHFQRRKDETNS